MKKVPGTIQKLDGAWRFLSLKALFKFFQNRSYIIEIYDSIIIVMKEGT